jgi:hypothetical protein
MADQSAIHFGRGWHGDPFVDDCGCRKAPCGLVDGEGINPDCKQHNGFETIRSSHPAKDCPADGDGH